MLTNDITAIVTVLHTCGIDTDCQVNSLHIRL